MLSRSSVAVNEVLDGAGRHRRLASGFILFGLILSLMGAVVWYRDGLSPFMVCHFVVAASLVWLASDLIRHGSLIDRRGVPHASQGALIAAVAVLRLSAPDFYADEFGGVPSVGVTLIALGVAYLLLMAGELRSSPAMSLGGRVVLVFAGTAYGIIQILRMANGFDAYPLYSLGLGSVGLLMLAMVVFEARVLRLAIQWLLAEH